MNNHRLHPGQVIAGEMEFLKMNVLQLAGALDVEPLTVDLLLVGKAAVTPDMAFRLAQAIGSTPEQWLRIQAAYDAAVQA
ncbi:HigA family addiction module antidote protein [Salmonella enterica]|nr:HigA family addiction module antidote protein [Salmonella enterica]